MLAIPVVVGLGAAWYTVQQGKVSDRENTDNQRERALQAYIDKISELLLHEHLGELRSENERIRMIARVRTLTVLRGLDATRKASVLKFLYESRLLEKYHPLVNLSLADLSGADLSDADLSGANLSGANLSRPFSGFSGKLDLQRLIGMIEAYTQGAYIRIAADLSGADLSRVNLNRANLHRTDLHFADLSEASLIRADLNTANLHGANLKDAVLSEADLSRADLSGANVTDKQLERVKSLQGATMPDGSRHP